MIDSGFPLKNRMIQENIQSGMRKMVLRADRPFHVILGFRLKILSYEGFDPFVSITSDERGLAVVELYLSKGAVEFIFIADQANLKIQTSISEEDQILKVPSKQKPVKPHWWQRVGLYS